MAVVLITVYHLLKHPPAASHSREVAHSSFPCQIPVFIFVSDVLDTESLARTFECDYAILLLWLIFVIPSTNTPALQSCRYGQNLKVVWKPRRTTLLEKGGIIEFMKVWGRWFLHSPAIRCAGPGVEQPEILGTVASKLQDPGSSSC